MPSPFLPMGPKRVTVDAQMEFLRRAWLDGGSASLRPTQVAMRCYLWHGEVVEGLLRPTSPLFNWSLPVAGFRRLKHLYTAYQGLSKYGRP